MAWGRKPKQMKCPSCRRVTINGVGCKCMREVDKDVERAQKEGRPDPRPRTCTVECVKGKGPCGKTMRGGYCPCAYCR